MKRVATKVKGEVGEKYDVEPCTETAMEADSVDSLKTKIDTF